MRSVRTKFIAVIVLCLLPMLVATRVFYWASREELRDDELEQIKAAKGAFSLELEGDLSTLQLAVRMLTSDVDLARELAANDRELLYAHLDDFATVYPNMHLYLTDASGALLATSHQKAPRGSLAMAEMRAVLAGEPFDGVTHIIFLEDGKVRAEERDSYALGRPILFEGKQVGALLTSFPLDQGFIDSVEKKQGLALALKIGARLVAHSPDHPAPGARLADGAVELQSFPGGREIAFAAFGVPSLGTAQGPVSVLAAKDVSEQFRDGERYLVYRLIALGVIALLALAAGLFIANPIVRAIQKIAAVLPGVALKKYEVVEGIRTGDELQALADTYNGMILHLRESAREREQLGKYLSRAARDAASKGSVDLGGTTMAATVLFSDIRGFTSLSEKMEPERVLALLNRYFTEMVGAVVRHRGIVDKFIGDCIMAVWGPPASQVDDALHAVTAALEMRERLARLNLKLAAEGFPELRTGIGIHTGPVVAGNMGAASTAELEGKMEYTVIGDTVNLASRLESLTKELHADVLLSEDTYRLVQDKVEVELLPPIKVRGREQSVAIFKLIRLKP